MINSAMPRVNVPRARANSPFFICACAVYVILKNRLQRGPLRETVRGEKKENSRSPTNEATGTTPVGVDGFEPPTLCL